MGAGLAGDALLAEGGLQVVMAAVSAHRDKRRGDADRQEDQGKGEIVDHGDTSNYGGAGGASASLSRVRRRWPWRYPTHESQAMTRKLHTAERRCNLLGPLR